MLRENASTALNICQLVTSVMLAQLLYKSWDHYTQTANAVRWDRWFGRTFKKIEQSCKARTVSFVVKTWKIFLGYWYFMRTWGQMAHVWYKTGWESGRCKNQNGGMETKQHTRKVIFAKSSCIGMQRHSLSVTFWGENAKVTEKGKSESLGGLEWIWNAVFLKSYLETSLWELSIPW